MNMVRAKAYSDEWHEQVGRHQSCHSLITAECELAEVRKAEEMFRRMFGEDWEEEWRNHYLPDAVQQAEKRLEWIKGLLVKEGVSSTGGISP
jgi:hypothetical protein